MILLSWISFFIGIFIFIKTLFDIKLMIIKSVENKSGLSLMLPIFDKEFIIFIINKIQSDIKSKRGLVFQMVVGTLSKMVVLTLAFIFSILLFPNHLEFFLSASFFLVLINWFIKKKLNLQKGVNLFFVFLLDLILLLVSFKAIIASLSHLQYFFETATVTFWLSDGRPLVSLILFSISLALGCFVSEYVILFLCVFLLALHQIATLNVFSLFMGAQIGSFLYLAFKNEASMFQELLMVRLVSFVLSFMFIGFFRTFFGSFNYQIDWVFMILIGILSMTLSQMVWGHFRWEKIDFSYFKKEE